MTKIAIIDTLGLCYDGSTLNKRGLGGSESAVILVSKELAALGFDVTVYNECEVDDCLPGVYDEVKYRPLRQANIGEHDIVIASRSIAPFAEGYGQTFQHQHRLPDFSHIMKHAKLKVLWMHDTFCDGDNLIEQLVVDGKLDEIFTLSDFHTSYVTNCNHGKARVFETLKKHMFITRNGFTRYIDFVDIKQKDPNLFVYNASVTKGMIPLVEKVWPKVRERIPEAKLKIIGGYYRFREDEGPDEQEKMLHELKETHGDSIEFTGIIKQSEIAEILAKASFFIYPAAFPETFGISTLESLAYNTPVITCDFGALEETAVDMACYKMPYPIEPNFMVPTLDTDAQVLRFADMVSQAWHNTYLHQQKMYACNIIDDTCSWASVALQWKQHFFKKLDLYLPVDEYRKVMKINASVHRIFGRRFMNKEEYTPPRHSKQHHITCIVPFYNAAEYLEKNILSIASQDYDNYTVVLIDDASTDNADDAIENALLRADVPHDVRFKFKVHRNNKNRGAVYNQYEHILEQQDDTIIMLIDGDDWLVNDNEIFQKYNNMYQEGAEFTYGSCWSVIDNIPLIAQPYPPEVKQDRSYRKYKFNWNMPYTHLRTFTRDLFVSNIVPEDLQDETTGAWYKAGGDGAIFYKLIENCDPDNIRCVTDIHYVYNDDTPLNDYRINGDEQTKTANKILGADMQQPVKKILIGIPTARNIEPTTYKAIYDLFIPDGYVADFQYFYGYNVDQVRNLIADWTIKGYDYLFAVDADISFPKDTLAKLLSHNADIVTGIYRQRLPEHNIEVYDLNMKRMLIEDIIDKPSPVQIGGCGFGCVLVKAEVFDRIGYPQFEYHSALDHNFTFSEDVDFCKKAVGAGFSLWCDPTVVCDHYGISNFKVEIPEKKLPATSHNERLRELGQQPLLPVDHVDFLKKISAEIKPLIIYDIGACVLHWTNEARKVWPDATYWAFDAMHEASFLYQEANLPHWTGVLTDVEKDIVFNKNVYHPGGNSYYNENPEYSPMANELWGPENKQLTRGYPLDAVVKAHSIPYPDLIKMDIQGAELDVLKGAPNVLKHAKYLILELQHKDYNLGAPKADEVIKYLEDRGWKSHGKFCGSDLGVDGDYYFTRD